MTPAEDYRRDQHVADDVRESLARAGLDDLNAPARRSTLQRLIDALNEPDDPHTTSNEPELK